MNDNLKVLRNVGINLLIVYAILISFSLFKLIKYTQEISILFYIALSVYMIFIYFYTLNEKSNETILFFRFALFFILLLFVISSVFDLTRFFPIELLQYITANNFYFLISLLLIYIGFFYGDIFLTFLKDNLKSKHNLANAKTFFSNGFSFFSKLKDYHSVILFFSILIGFILRVSYLSYSGLYTDESGTYLVVKDIIKHGFSDYPRSRVYLYLVTLFNYLFGISVFNLRFLSVIIGTLSIPLFYYIVKKWFNSDIALLSAVLLAINPLHIAFSRASRMYILFYLVFFVLVFFIEKLICLYFRQGLMKLIKNHWQFLLGFGFLFWLAMDTHVASLEAGIFAIIFFVLYFFYHYNDFNVKGEIKYYVLIAFLIFIYAVNSDFIHSVFNLLSLLDNPNFSYNERIINRIGKFAIMLSFFGLLSFTSKFFNFTKQKLIFLGLILGSVSIYLIRIYLIDTYATTRYVTHLLLFFILFLAFSIYYLSKSVSRKYWYVISIILLIPILIFSYNSYEVIINEYSGYIFIDTYIDNYKDAVSAVEIDSKTCLTGTVPQLVDFYKDIDKGVVFEYHYEMWADNQWDINDWLDVDERFQFEMDFICSCDEGYYFGDSRRFNRFNTVPSNLKKVIVDNFELIETPSRDVEVYYWTNSILKQKNLCPNYVN